MHQNANFSPKDPLKRKKEKEKEKKISLKILYSRWIRIDKGSYHHCPILFQIYSHKSTPRLQAVISVLMRYPQRIRVR
jgi:hypothetical protein